MIKVIKRREYQEEKYKHGIRIKMVDYLDTNPDNWNQIESLRVKSQNLI
jgi:hypothetical protein